MNLRWSSYVAPKPSKRGPKTQNGRFSSKIALRLKKVCYKVSFCENKASVGLTIRVKIIGGATPSTWNFGSNWPRWSEIADFQSIFARSASAVTSREKSSINTNCNWGTNRKSTRFPMSSSWTSYVVLKPQRGAQKRKVSKIWPISCDNSETVRDRMSVTVH